MIKLLNPNRRASRIGMLVVVGVLINISGCGGSHSVAEESAVNTRTIESQTEDVGFTESPSTGEAGATDSAPEEAPSGAYTRIPDYPRIKTAPLQYIDSTSGHRMGVRVTLPANEDGTPAEGPFPVILIQSAYNIGLMSLMPLPGGVLLGAPDPFMVRRGYAMVAVDVIGGGTSEGGWEMLGEEEQSGYGDVVDWIQQQAWANGDIGVAGASYMAITSLFTAQQRPDDIKAIFASVPMGDPLRGTVGTGGILNGVFMSTWMTLTHLTSTQNLITMLLHPELMDIIMGSTQRHVDQVDHYYLPVIEKAINGDPVFSYDGEFWRVRSPIENIDRIQAPTFIMGALDDIFQRDEPLIYEALKDRVDARLMIFNGDHIGHFMQALPGTEKTDPILNLVLQWFDKHLKGMDSGTERIPAVTQYVKGYKNGNWQGFASTTDWPHPAAEPDRWYLHGDGSLNQQAPFDQETTRVMTQPEFAGYDYGKSADGGFVHLDFTLNDGTRCSPSYVQWTLGSAGIARSPKCFRDTAQLEREALNYETEAMTEAYYINGPIQADLFVSSTARDAVVSVRIDEVTPQGRVIPLSNGLLLASARALDESRSRYLYGEMVQPYHYFTQSTEQLLVPGEVVKMHVEVFPTSALIRKGNKLRVSISPSNQAQGILNLPRRELARDGVTSIHNSAEYPSSVVLLSVPVSELN